MTLRVEKKKWIFYRHTRDLELAIAVGKYLKEYGDTSIATEKKQQLLSKLKDAGMYNERNPDLPLDALNHKINTLGFFMFGYKEKINGQDKFLFSPLGNLYFQNLNDKEKLKKIFLTMLWGIQFQHPHSGTDASFQLYPFRLIYKLLLDQRLEYKLHAYEIALAVVFVDKIQANTYENLLQRILELRTYDNERIISELMGDEHLYVNAVYEWDYYMSTLLESGGILNRTEGEVITKLQHGTSSHRRVTRNTVTIPEDLKEYCKKLLLNYPVDALPAQLDDKERIKSDVIKEIYSFYPEELLKEIGEFNEELKSILDLPKLIDQYANNNEGNEAYLFEDVLEEGFNQFFNVDARKIGGAGQTDLECLYLTQKTKFSVDAKSTKNKLSGLNAGRLDHHRRLIGGKYTIVVTPRYVPAVKEDIRNTSIVILLASTFSEYLYNNMVNNVREIDYADFDTIITNNLGTDISKQVSELTITRFAVKNNLSEPSLQ